MAYVATRGGERAIDQSERLFRAEMGEIRKERVAEIRAQLLGGMPPHLASMHSTAPWWRAQKAAEWIERREREGNGIAERLRRGFWGDDFDGLW